MLLYDFETRTINALASESVERSFSLIRCPYETINGVEILNENFRFVPIRLDAGLVRRILLGAQVRHLNDRPVFADYLSGASGDAYVL